MTLDSDEDADVNSLRSRFFSLKQSMVDAADNPNTSKHLPVRISDGASYVSYPHQSSHRIGENIFTGTFHHYTTPLNRMPTDAHSFEKFYDGDGDDIADIRNKAS